MTTLFVRHTVSDYKVWRKVYDSFGPIQKAMAVKAEAVYQAADNPNDVTVTHEKAMQDAGVVGAPTLWITNKA